MKLSGNQIDDRIVEVHWDSELSHWRLMRFRDDKPNGNHRTVAENIIQSIVDGVEKDAVSSYVSLVIRHLMQVILAACAINIYPKCLEGPPWSTTTSTYLSTTSTEFR
jgi:hypothetical protein